MMTMDEQEYDETFDSQLEVFRPFFIIPTWLSNSTAQAIAWMRVNPEVLVLIPFSFSHLSLVTWEATRECLDWMLGNGPLVWAGIAFHCLSEDPPPMLPFFWNCVITLRVSSMTLSVGRLLAIMCLAVPRSSMMTKAFLAIPSSASKTPYFLEIFPDLSARRGILHLPSSPPSAL